MLKEQAFKRMQDGLRKVLQLHTPVELSSLCGCLHLKVQEKASTSIDQIIRYACETEELDLERISQILRYMWEGPLWEYLHCTGHPIHSMRTDPKSTVLQLWENGGFLDGAKGFNPHFVARVVKNRYENVQSEDIRSRLEQLRIAQEAVKTAETKILADHDYTNILSYFKKMYELRGQENSMRDYLIGEIEATRGKIDSGLEIGRICREQIEELELFSIAIAENLNKKLAEAESTALVLSEEKLQMEADVQGLVSVTDSFIESETSREAVGGGGGVAPKFIRFSRGTTPSLKLLQKKLQEYKQLRDSDNDSLRKRCRDQLAEFEVYEQRIRSLQEELARKSAECASERRHKAAALEAVAQLARTLTRERANHFSATRATGESLFGFAEATRRFRLQHSRIKPLLLAGLEHSNKTVFELCFTLLNVLEVLPAQEHGELLERLGMSQEDHLSQAVRYFEATRGTRSKSGKSFRAGRW